MIEFTREELEALRFWLSVVGHRGTREQLRRALALYDVVLDKIEVALGTSPGESANLRVASAIKVEGEE